MMDISGRSLVLRVTLLAAGVLACAGCGGEYRSSVTGTVKLGGEPLRRGTVTFHPLEKGAAAYGLVDSDGRFTLGTGREQGLAPGEYIATVVATEASPAESGGGTPPIGKLITPARYGDKSTSGLRYTVKPGKNDFEVSLEAR